MPSQNLFFTVYRGNQGALRHSAYMRMSKVLLIQHVLRRFAIELADKRIFDYGFGAGTFFRYCPKSSQLFGVELDPVCVAEVSAMLAAQGFTHVDLQPLPLDTWQNHPLLQQSYDLVIGSHVLEHLPDPAGFLRRIQACLLPGGQFVGLVPINERRQDSHHVQIVYQPAVQSWLNGTVLRLQGWVESDPALYWVQPLFTYESGWRHRTAQALSMAIGPVAKALGPERWFALGKALGILTRSKPTQAALVLQRVD